MTTFGDAIKQYGGVPVGGGVLPLFGRDAKAFFVDPANGNDNNSGLTPAQALDTVSAAYAKAVDKRGDVIYLMNDGNTSGTAREAATITWAKDNTHLIGWCAPSMISQRARISPPTSQTTIVTPQLSVTADGCIFANLSLFEGTSQDATPSIGVQVSGSRNYFYNVAIMNLGDATNGHSGDEATSAHLKIAAGSENLFERCYIGLDTAARSTTNANVELTSAATRNIFKDCVFPAFADNNGVLFVKIDAAGDIDRYVIFERCLFLNATNSTATSMTGAMDVHASAGGHVIVKDCMLVGAADWEAADSTVIKLLGGIWNGTDDVNIGIGADLDVTA